MPLRKLLLQNFRMFKKGLLLILLSVCTIVFQTKAQQVPLNLDSLNKTDLYLDSSLIDSLAIVKIADTVTPKLLKPLDSIAIAQITDSLSKGFGFPEIDFDALNKKFRLGSISQSTFQKGIILPQGDVWVLAVVAFLLIVFAVVKQTFSKQLGSIIQSFFSNRALSNLNKEDNLFTSWPFLLLFIQFGFTIGMFFYLVAKNQDKSLVADGFQSYLTISIIIVILYVLKILILRIMGFIFNVQKPVNEYVSILYLSYFNSSLLFIPLVLAFALSPLKHSDFYVVFALILVGVIFVFQFIRAGINILSHYRFSKVYLILYFCTLEICPILILIKAIGF